MSELRQNRVTGEWVIISTERASRPEDFHRQKETPPALAFNPKCPFCHGNEHLTPPESICVRDPSTVPNTKGWSVRVVPNKYPALDPHVEADWFDEAQFFNGVQGFGIHDVIIDSPEHNKSTATMTKKQVEDVFHVYRECFRRHERDERILIVNIFRNYGIKAGASLEHPHSQLLATPIIPTRIQLRLNVAKEYYDVHGRCILCDTVERSLSIKERMVMETDGFVVFEPFASQTPFETWIIPKRHYVSFSETEDKDIKELAHIMRDILYRISSGLGDPDYNYFIQANPSRTRFQKQYHWYVQILPRIATSIGFELSSGIYICTVKPEIAADFLRNMPSPPD